MPFALLCGRGAVTQVSLGYSRRAGLTHEKTLKDAGPSKGDTNSEHPSGELHQREEPGECFELVTTAAIEPVPALFVTGDNKCIIV